MTAPFFSIGITTYNRHDLLREALLSILTQDFGDFEVIVGNDYQAETLTLEMLDIDDPRVCIINHPVNLREVGNMNALLNAATGRYFTWLFDDDLYEPGFLSAAHRELARHTFPAALFPSFRLLRGTDSFTPQQVTPRSSSVMTGREYLSRFFAGKLRIISTCGFFETAAVRKVVGGVEELCQSAIGVYCEYLFLVRCALLERICFMDAPYVVFRTHSESWSEGNSELHKYESSAPELLRRSAEVLRHPALQEDFDRNLLGVAMIHLSTYCFRSARVETGGGNFGALSFTRAASRVLVEARRNWSVYRKTGGSARASAAVRFGGMITRSLYLTLYGFLFDGWRRVKEGAPQRSAAA
ncbi:glycosyltransferase family 2 protein [Geomonas sp. RF6]|uniref:glycosyltransferase family 2 protein n=1 Tax=Geomonas sp. RF6 TaxID=2897342 RepID=UPI001E39394A|nr:glycosyltransferase family 2 protein [Geomonas sp. RF6]UFS71047.1 glycosyltransferase family 2 protein [Geomonas sp. RF6]